MRWSRAPSEGRRPAAGDGVAGQCRGRGGALEPAVRRHREGSLCARFGRGRIGSALGAGLARRDDAGAGSHRTANPEAHDLVLRGQFLTEQSTEAGLRRGDRVVRARAALDSTYADPWNGIAQAWFFLADTYMAPRQPYRRWGRRLKRRLRSTPPRPGRTRCTGHLLATYLRDFAAARAGVPAAIALDSTTPFGGDYGWVLHARGLDDSAPAVVRRARRHNPFSFAPANLAVVVFLDQGMLDSAAAPARPSPACGQRLR